MEGKAKVYKEFARLRSDEGNYQKALEYYKTALDIHTNETYSLNGKAQYYFEYAKLLMQFDTNLAENMLNSALDCYKHLCDDKQLAAVYEYFGKLEMERFEYLNAIKNNLQRSYSFYKSKDNIHGQASCLINILICMRKGNLNNEENKHFLIEAEDLLSKSNELDCKITNKLNAELMKFLDVK
jgi:tetratricopeptide (TPR) repeat protein